MPRPAVAVRIGAPHNRGVDTAPLEITDVIVDYDAESLERLPVKRDAALQRLAASGASAGAVRACASLPVRDGILVASAVDDVMVSCHGEMQRLWETFCHGERVLRVLRSTLAAIRSRDGDPTRKLRIADVGCGTGYVVRWLAARGELENVDLIGVDYNRALIEMATRLATAESLRVRFVVGNAFHLDEPADIYLSTGVIHHFRGQGLSEFFAAQAQASPEAFLHFDIQKSWAAPIGAWIFHKAHMRVQIAQHDGYVSALRAHSGADVLAAAKASAGDLWIAQLNPPLPLFPMLRTMHAVVGIRPNVAEEFRRLTRDLPFGAQA